MKAGFTDHELLLSLGLGQALNMPVESDGRVAWTIDLLRGQPAFDDAEVHKARWSLPMISRRASVAVRRLSRLLVRSTLAADRRAGPVALRTVGASTGGLTRYIDRRGRDSARRGHPLMRQGPRSCSSRVRRDVQRRTESPKSALVYSNKAESSIQPAFCS